MKAKANSVLEKKLEELESLLEAITINDNDPNVYRKLVLGVLFAKTLLAAEISSRPIDVEGQEDVEFKHSCMATRLNEIEAFLTNHDNGSLIELENLETNESFVNSETGSVYSLVESCLMESGKAEEEEEEDKEEVVAEQCTSFKDASSEKLREITFPAMETEEEEVVVEREVKRTGRVGFMALVCFGLIGLVGGMIGLFGYIGDNLMDDHFFPTPT